MKVFLSHKMSGVSVAKVSRIRANAKIHLAEKYPNETIEIIDNYNHFDAPVNAGRLWHLGRSIQQLEEADAIYFCKGNCKTKGCIVEKVIVFLYKIPVLK